MHPALVILASVVFVQTIALLGKERLQEWTYAVYSRIVHHRTLSEQRKLRADVFATKQQLAKTSSQDEFAKWAKLRRKVDKGIADLDKLNGTLSSSRTTFTLLFKGLMFILTTLLPFAVTSYYGKTPIFWLPPGGNWFGPLGWFLSLPRAPAGSVSSTMWQMVCTRAILSVLSSGKSLLPVKVQEEVVVPPSEKPDLSSPSTGTDAAPASAPASASGGARRRTNVAASASKEKQEL